MQKIPISEELKCKVLSFYEWMKYSNSQRSNIKDTLILENSFLKDEIMQTQYGYNFSYQINEVLMLVLARAH